jgi:WD40 repeat protein
MLPLSGHRGPITGLAYSPDSRLLASSGWDGDIRLWNLTQGHITDEFRTPHRHALAVAFAPNGQALAAGFRRHPVEELGNAALIPLDPQSGRFELQPDIWQPHTPDVRVLAFHPGGDWLATGGSDGSVRLWQPGPLGPLPLRSFFYTDSPVFGLAVSQRGDAIASLGYADGVVSLWESATGKRQGALHQGAFGQALAIAPQLGLLAAAVGWDVIVWAIDGPRLPPRLLHRLSGKPDEVLTVAFSADGRTILAGDRAGIITAWDATTGQMRSRLNWELAEVRALACAPDGLTIAAGGDTGEILVWDVDPDAW